RAHAYHAGLKASEREAVQEGFMDGDAEVIVATTAFGLGVDRAAVRFVFHAEVPESVDSYYQEVGRAGRDGEPAQAVLFYRPEDLGLRRFFAGGALGVDGCARDELEDAVQRAAEGEEQRHAFDRSRVEMMRAYAEHDGCRRQFILSYFGEKFEVRCGNCDNCDAGLSQASAADRPFAVGARVEHAEWGKGAVQRYDGDQMTVLFAAVGYKPLSVALVVEGGLLTLSR